MRSVLITMSVIATTLFLVSCPLETGTGTIFHETFDAYNPAAWHITGSAGSWSVAPVLPDMDNALQTAGGDGSIIYEGYTGGDYTVSVRWKPAATDSSMYLLTRMTVAASNSGYAMVVTGYGTNPSQVELWKIVNGVGIPCGTMAYYMANLNTAVFHTLTMTVQGSLITVRITDGTVSSSFSYDDNMNLGGVAAFTSGEAGIYGTFAGSANSFDDFKITVP